MIEYKIWNSIMDNSLKYPNRTFDELRNMYDLGELSSEHIEKIKEIIYDLRKDPSFDHALEGIDMLKMRIDTTGNIGIGCVNPETVLHVTTTGNYTINFTN